MNYRHAYHAGNFGDVLKHAVLALVIEHMKLKPSPLRFIDTHAGIGAYDLGSTASTKTLEWQGGIGRLIGPAASPIPADLAAVLAPYLDVVRSLNPAGRLKSYPGSPLLAARLLRRDDVLVLNELHPEDQGTLRATFARDARVKILCIDASLAVKSLLPPKERRGIVLIDPAYEERDELQQVARALSAALRRFATGTFLLWYPIKDLPPIEAFHAEIDQLGIGKCLRADLYTRAPDTPERLNGCGLLVVNPPWTLGGKLARLLPFLAGRLKNGPAEGWRLDPPRS